MLQKTWLTMYICMRTTTARQLHGRCTAGQSANHSKCLLACKKDATSVRKSTYYATIKITARNFTIYERVAPTIEQCPTYLLLLE